MSNWKAGMAFDSILQTPLDYYDVTYANGNTVRYEKERPHGEWIYHKEWELDGECAFECSKCGMGTDTDYNFCPNCGLPMKKEGEAE